MSGPGPRTYNVVSSETNGGVHLIPRGASLITPRSGEAETNVDERLLPSNSVVIVVDEGELATLLKTVPGFLIKLVKHILHL